MDGLRKLSVVVACVLAGVAMQASDALAQDQVQWASDYQAACQAAREQQRLLLLHFYSDDCPPCVRVDQQVFSQATVAQAIAKNYVPLKIHARQSPELARRYQVTRWPTDVFCTAAGLEIYRTTSPQTPAEYMGLVDQVALQAGVGAGKQWATNVQSSAQQTAETAAGQAQAFANRVALSAEGYADRATAQAQGYAGQAQNQSQGYANQSQGYAAGAQQQFQQTTGQAQATAQQYQQQLAGASQQFNTTAQQAAAGAAGAYQDLRSAWTGGSVPTGAAATSPPAGAFAAAAGYGAVQPQPQPSPYAAAPQQPAAPQESANPWIGQQQAFQAQQPVQPQQPAAVPAPGPAGGQQLVPASQAPAIGLEGYCPVTLLESMKWKKADPQFGAIHRGRTYLFASAAEQQKFLADPDRFSPVLSGCDPVRFAQRGELVPGTRSCGLTFNKQIFLFADEASLKTFEASPQTYMAPAYQAMLQGETGGTVYR